MEFLLAVVKGEKKLIPSRELMQSKCSDIRNLRGDSLKVL